MIKLIIKLGIVALIANATWRVGNAYLSYYRFTDSVTQAAQFGATKSEAELHERVLELATQYDVPLAEDAFTIRRERSHTIVDGAYTQLIDVVPGYTYPWPFKWSIDTYTVAPPRADSLLAPQP